MTYLLSTMILFALFAGYSASAYADNIVGNGGFEDGFFAIQGKPGWTMNDPTVGSYIVNMDNIMPGRGKPSPPHSGDCYAVLGTTGQLGTISQDLKTTAKTTYTVDFFLASDGQKPNEFKVMWGGKTVFDKVNIPTQDYTEYKFQVHATMPSTKLTFLNRNDNGWFLLDDISVSKD